MKNRNKKSAKINRKKTIEAAIGLLLALLFLTALCTDKKETLAVTASTNEQATTTTAETAATSTTSAVPLSDLQKGACDSADVGHTCQTKLANLGIVSPDDCCKYLDKCCPIN